MSNAFLNSTNVQYSFLPNEKYNSIRECKTNRLSIVEYPFLKPAWFSEMTFNSLENKLSLVFKIQVNNFPRQLIRVIARKLSGSNQIKSKFYLKSVHFITAQHKLSRAFQTDMHNKIT